jgi:putative copper export protein
MFNGALPAGNIDAAHVPLLLARAVWLVGLLSATGALLFRAFEAQTEAGRFAPVRAGLTRIIAASLMLACVGWLIWVVLQAATIAGATTPASAFSALAPVFSRTLFGHVATAQIALLVLACATLWLGWRWARALPALCALGATMLQAGHLHAWAMEGTSLLTAAVVLHLWAAAGWLGALLPLRQVVRLAPLPAAISAVRRFSVRAKVLVLVLLLTAVLQSLTMLGGVAGLFGATYGWVAMSKAVLFAVLLGFAWRNRFRLTPALAGPEPDAARAALARSIFVETGVAIAVVLVAAVLTALPPGMHVQPIWPFTGRPRLPIDGAEMAVLASLVASVALLGRAVLWRRLLLPVLAAMVVLGCFAVPRLGALTQPATPTSFWQSPTGFTASSVADGGVLFVKQCAACHATGLPTSRLAAIGDGDLLWLLTAGGPAMPGFAATLDDDARWHVIDFLRARAAAGSLPVRAPDLDIACADGTAQSLGDLRGRLVRLVFPPAAGDATPPAAPAGVQVLTVLVPRPPVPEQLASGCEVTDPYVRTAYAAATGISSDGLAGAEVLIDAEGWLRELLHPNADAAALREALGRAATPVPLQSGRDSAARPAG